MRKKKTKAEIAAELIGLYEEASAAVFRVDADSDEWHRRLKIKHKRLVNLLRALLKRTPTNDDLDLIETRTFDDDYPAEAFTQNPHAYGKPINVNRNDPEFNNCAARAQFAVQRKAGAAGSSDNGKE